MAISQVKISKHYDGKKVPLYAVTENGRKLLNERLEYIGYGLCEKKYP